MRRRLSYRDAVRILGGNDSRLVDAADALLSAGVLGLAAVEPGALGLLDACTKVSGLTKKLVAGLGRRVRGVPGHSRTELLVAAHTVIVVAAFFEALGELQPKAAGKRVKYATKNKLQLTGSDVESLRVGHLVDALLSVPVSIPAPHRPYERTLAELGDFYERIMVSLGLTPEDIDAIEIQVGWRMHVSNRAVERYEELFRQLAVDCPELFVWASLQEHAATRRAVGEPLERLHATLSEVRTGLAGLGAVLDGLAGRTAPAGWPDQLATAYRALLDRPIAETTADDTGLRIPTLAEAYVHPSFRVTAMDRNTRPAVDAWWDEIPVRDDVQGFLAGHLTSPGAAEAPLVILGHPGAGKSVLTKVLAARLPAADYLPVRVELRAVSADAAPQDQIEYALREGTGERMDWPALVRAADGALPVVLLDGFDELLQSTGVSRSDYLEQLAAFQRREADQGRPVAVCVTSRTVVADQARIPDDCVVLRLEPFDAERVRRWLDAWNETNREHFISTGLRPLSADAVLRYPHLTRQPLLLLMLALYDSAGNALQNAGDTMSQAELYERLLDRFVRRQVTKHRPGLLPEELNDAVQGELARLSVVALAMFNRGRQSATEEEVDADLRALLDEAPAAEGSGFHAPLSPARLLVGRFFFVHEALATRADAQVRAYEFLHATFGEYLVARMVMAALRDLAVHSSSAARATALPTAVPRVEDALLYALLSFAPLTDREAVVGFLRELADKVEPDLRESLRNLLIRWLRDCLRARPPGPYDGYRPAAHDQPRRYAAHSANLLLLTVALSGEIRASELFPDEPIPSWRRYALLWKSQLRPSSWGALVEALVLVRTREAAPDRRPQAADLRLSFDGSALPPKHELADFGWSFASWPGASFDPTFVMSSAAFLGDPDFEAVMHTALPAFMLLSETTECAHLRPKGDVVTLTHALLRLRLGSADVDDYATCLDFSPRDNEDGPEAYLRALLRQLNEDARRLPVDFVSKALEELTSEPLSMEHGLLLIDCVLSQFGRDGADDAALSRALSHVVDEVSSSESVRGQLRMWLRIVETGATALLGDRPSAEELDRALLDPSLVREPMDVVGVFRLAREFGRHEWVAEHAPALLARLPYPALFLLRPSDVEYLRATASFDEELAERLDSVRRRHAR